MNPNQLSKQIIGAAIEVHRELGPGKVEVAYERALCRELESRRLAARAQRALPVVYKGVKLDCGYRLDVLVEDQIVVEVKSVDAVAPIHKAQVLTYLKLGGCRLALLLNFNVALLKEGIQRFVMDLQDNGVPSRRGWRDRTEQESLSPLPSPRVCGDPATMKPNQLSEAIIGAAVEVHRTLGPGLLPSTYEHCLCHELALRGIPFKSNVPVPLTYKGKPLGETSQVGLLVADKIIVQPLAVKALEPVHQAEMLSQLRLSQHNLGLLLNFNVPSLIQGVRRCKI